MRAVSIVTLLLCLHSGAASADDELDVAFAADQKLITSTTIESEGLQLKAVGNFLATKALLVHQKRVLAQAEIDFTRISNLFDKNAVSRHEFLGGKNRRDRARLEVDIVEARIDKERFSAELWKLRLIESGADADFRLPLAEALLELYKATLRGLDAAAEIAKIDHDYYDELAVMQDKLVLKNASTAQSAEHARLDEKEKQQIADAVATEIKFLKQAIEQLKKTIGRLKVEEGGGTPAAAITPRRLDIERTR